MDQTGGAGVSLPRRQLKVLRQIETGISGSDPGLASKLAGFARMNADEVMPDHERWRCAFARTGSALLTVVMGAAVLFAHAMSACLRGTPVAAGALWSGPCRWGTAGLYSPARHPSWYE
jgi:hypothetical protein